VTQFTLQKHATFLTNVSVSQAHSTKRTNCNQ